MSEIRTTQAFNFERDAAPAVFATLLGVVIVFHGAVLALFYRRRHMQPVSARPFRTVVAQIVFFGLYAAMICLRWAIPRGNPCAVFLVFAWPSCMAAANCHLVRVWLLWFKYKITMERSNLTSFNTNAADAAVKHNWYIEHKHYGSDSFLLMLFLANQVPETLLLWANFVAVPGSRTEVQDIRKDWCPSVSAFAFPVFLAEMVFVASFYVYATFRFGKVADGFFLKRELALTAYIAVVVFPFWLGISVGLGSSLFASMWLVLAGMVFVSAVGLYPILKSYEIEKQKSTSYSNSDSDGSDHAETFQKLLDGPESREEFRQHLKLEFAIENLLFWETVESYRSDYHASSATDNKVLATEIRKRFVNDGAPLQINVDFRTHKQLISDLEGSDTPSIEVFDCAQRKIFDLMVTDSYKRFRQKLRRMKERDMATNSETVDVGAVQNLEKHSKAGSADVDAWLQLQDEMEGASRERTKNVRTSGNRRLSVGSRNDVSVVVDTETSIEMHGVDVDDEQQSGDGVQSA